LVRSKYLIGAGNIIKTVTVGIGHGTPQTLVTVKTAAQVGVAPRLKPSTVIDYPHKKRVA